MSLGWSTSSSPPSTVAGHLEWCGQDGTTRLTTSEYGAGLVRSLFESPLLRPDDGYRVLLHRVVEASSDCGRPVRWAFCPGHRPLCSSGVTGYRAREARTPYVRRKRECRARSAHAQTRSRHARRQHQVQSSPVAVAVHLGISSSMFPESTLVLTRPVGEDNDPMEEGKKKILSKQLPRVAWTAKLWIYDLRTNLHFTLKENPLRRADLNDFVACFNPNNRHERVEKRASTWTPTSCRSLVPFCPLKFAGDPGCPASSEELRRQAAERLPTDGSAEYSAFISYTLRGKRNETVGHNHPFVVYAAYETRGGQRRANQKRPSNLVSDHSSTINTHRSLGASREPAFRESIRNRLRVCSENLLLNHQNP